MLTREGSKSKPSNETDLSYNELINPLYLTKEYALQFRETLSGNNEFSHPFPHFTLSSFLISKEFVNGLRMELLNAKYNRKESDLFSLEQTADLANTDTKEFPILGKFRNLLENDVLRWLRNISRIDLNSEVALSSSRYNYTDLLLPHDDHCEGRAFAFTYYLTPNWKQDDGGQLVFYNCDDDNNPTSAARSTNPEENTLVIFEVSPRSWHMVTEVVSQKSRVSLHGWFHHTSNTENCDRIKSKTSELRSKPHINITYDEVLDWINPRYIDTTQQMPIRLYFEENSEICLTDFIQKSFYGNMKRLREDALPVNSNLRTLLRLVRSKAMALLLSQWTGLTLTSIDVDDDDDDDNPNSSGPDVKKKKLTECASENGLLCKDIEYNSSVYRIEKGCYTLVDDQIMNETEQLGHCLDFMLFLGANEWDEKYGGCVSYVGKNEEEELIRAVAVGNTVALVYFEPGVQSFVKYVNSRAGDLHYYMIKCSFYGFTQDDCASTTDEEEGIENGEKEESDEAGTNDSIN